MIKFNLNFPKKFWKRLLIAIIIFLLILLSNISNVQAATAKFYYSMYTSSNVSITSDTANVNTFVMNNYAQVKSLNRFAIDYGYDFVPGYDYTIKFKINYTGNLFYPSDGTTLMDYCKSSIFWIQGYESDNNTCTSIDSTTIQVSSIFKANENGRGDRVYFGLKISSGYNVVYRINTTVRIKVFDLELSSSNDNNVSNNAIINGLDDLNKNITDDSDPNLDNSFGNIELSNDSAISDLVLLPINFLNRMINLGNASCQPYSLPFGIFKKDYTLTLPCINLTGLVGNELTTTIDYLICFFMVYNLSMLFISAFEDFTSLRDTYEAMYQPKHAAKEYQPKHGGD